MTEDYKLSLLVSTGVNKYDVNIHELTSSTKSIIKTINFNEEILVSFDNYEKNVAVYETFSKNLSIYTLSGTRKSFFRSEFDLNCISSYQDRWLLGCDKLGKIYLYDIKKDRFKKCINSSNSLNNGISKLCVSINARSAYCLHDKGIISTFDIKTYNSEIFTCAGEINSSIENCPWSMNHLLAGSRNGTVTLYDDNKQMPLGKWNIADDAINCLSFCASNNFVMLCGSNRRAALIGKDDQTPLKIFSTTSRVTSCTLSDKNLLAFGESDGTVTVYDYRKVQRPLCVIRNKDPVRYMQFSCTMPTSMDGADYGDNTRVLLDDDTYDLSLYRETQLLDYSLNLSGNSLLSRSGGGVGHGDGDNHHDDDPSCLALSPEVSAFVTGRGSMAKKADFDLSHFVPSSTAVSRTAAKSAMPAPGAPPKARQVGKQVQFETGEQLVHPATSLSQCVMPPPLDHTRSLPSFSTVTMPCTTNVTGIPLDTAMIRRLINEEIKAELIQFESRIQNQIICSVVDQLAITEYNIVERLLEPTRRIQELTADNERLQQELRKYKYNF